MFIWKKSNKSSPFRQMKYTSIPKKHSCQRRCCTSINNIKEITYTLQNSSCSTTCTGRDNKPGCKLNTKSPICCTDADADGSGCKDQNNICGIGGDVSLCERTVLSCSGGDSDEWDGWATSTHYTDKSKGFCGVDPSNSGIKYTVGIPWNILCKEFGSKHCLLNHLCPNCVKCHKNCGTEPTAGRQKCPEDSASLLLCNGKSCPSVESHKNGIDVNGVCWEVQPVDMSYDKFNPNFFKTNDDFPLYNGGTQNIGSLPSHSDTFIVQLFNGCGGNCQNSNNTCDTTTTPHDCTNDCAGGAGAGTANPCDMEAKNPIGESAYQCNFMSTIKDKPYNYDICNIKQYNALQNISGGGGTCPLPYGPSGGNFDVKPTISTNWCSGAHMHFDFNIDYPPDFVQNNIIRYRRVKCPHPTPKNTCSILESGPPCDSSCASSTPAATSCIPWSVSGGTNDNVPGLDECATCFANIKIKPTMRCQTLCKCSTKPSLG